MKTRKLMPAIVFFWLTIITVTTPTAAPQQDLTFRVVNVERRVDQLQSRVDFVERSQQNQSLNNLSDPTAATQTRMILDLQRQHLSLAEQVITLQKRVLDLQKTIDQLRETKAEPEKKPKEEAKPKVPSKP